MREVIGVLRGGPSSEYDVSLKSGAAILDALNQEKYEPRDLFVSRTGEWHLFGVPVTPERALRGIDVVVNAMHGEFGEDGQVQAVLEAMNMPYTGSRSGASSLAFNKIRTQKAVDALGVKTAHSAIIDFNKVSDLDKTAFNIFRSMPHPLMVKPSIGGSSVGTTFADSYHALRNGLNGAFKMSPRVLVEEYIKGKEATVGVIEDFRGEKTYALMPVEIVPPPSSPFFDYDAKYSGKSIERVPGYFSSEQKKELQELAKRVHAGLGLSHYSRSDFIVSKRGIYFLEVNTLPGLTTESLLPRALHAVGSKLSHFLDHIIMLAKPKHV